MYWLIWLTWLIDWVDLLIYIIFYFVIINRSLFQVVLPPRVMLITFLTSCSCWGFLLRLKLVDWIYLIYWFMLFPIFCMKYKKQYLIINRLSFQTKVMVPPRVLLRSVAENYYSNWCISLWKFENAGMHGGLHVDAFLVMYS